LFSLICAMKSLDVGFLPKSPISIDFSFLLAFEELPFHYCPFSLEFLLSSHQIFLLSFFFVPSFSRLKIVSLLIAVFFLGVQPPSRGDILFFLWFSPCRRIPFPFSSARTLREIFDDLPSTLPKVPPPCRCLFLNFSGLYRDLLIIFYSLASFSFDLFNPEVSLRFSRTSFRCFLLSRKFLFSSNPLFFWRFYVLFIFEPSPSRAE